MDDKKIYEILNDVEINLGEMDEVSEIEKKRMKKNFRNRNRKPRFNKAIMVAGLALLIGIGSQTQLGNRVYASAQSKLSEISYSIGKSLGLERDIDHYSNVIDQTVENKGVGIRLTDVIIDRDELIVSSLIDFNGLDLKDEVISTDFNSDVYINGRKIELLGSTGALGLLDGRENTFFHSEHIDIEGIEQEEELDIRIVFDKLSYYGEDYEKKHINGKWEYKFKASGKELALDTEENPLDYSFNVGEEEYILDDVRINPVNQKIYGRVKNSPDMKNNISLRGEDNLGNQIEFSLTSRSGGDLVFKYENIDGNLREDIDYIKLTPYFSEMPRESGRMKDNWQVAGEEFTIELN